MKGVIIEWLKPKTSIDYNNLVEGTDYRIINPNNEYPRSDGEPVEFIGFPNYEWLKRVYTPQPNYDPRLYVLQVSEKPTNVKDTIYPKINTFVQSYQVIERSKADIIASIRLEQQMADGSLYQECDINKLSVLMLGYNTSIAKGLTPSEAQVNAYNRQQYIELKIQQNAANADTLIEAINNGQMVDISSGWENDNVPAGGFPFSN